MLTDSSLLTKPLYSFTSEELEEIKRVADSVFARLVSPFRQTHVAWQFDFKQSIRHATRTGHILPQYVRTKKTHPKSKIVIAMSLSGIDRCYAVGLIPLLSELRKYLNFKLFIYTDNLIEAEFTHDGFLANDCDLAWNNVLAPTMFHRLSKLEVDPQVDKLLIIDSLGGGDSAWYEYVYKNTLDEIQEVQQAYCGENSAWSRARKYIGGNYSRVDEMAYLLPDAWHEKLEANCNKRWVETPAMKEYLIRYIFNPRFGMVKHGRTKTFYQNNMYAFFSLVKEKFRSVHWLTPVLGEGKYKFKNFIQRRLIDFHHQADTLEGFAQMLMNLVYGRETNRLSAPEIKFVNYTGLTNTEKEEHGHSELTKTYKDCFADCEKVEPNLPDTTIKLRTRIRGTNMVVDIDKPASKINCIGWLMDGIEEVMPKWRIDRSWSEYSCQREVDEILNFIKNFRVCSIAHPGCIQLETEPRKETPSWDSILSNVKYPNSRALRKHVVDAMSLVSDAYAPYLRKLPLQYAVWCSVGKFAYQKMAISSFPSDSIDTQRETVFHEFGHWLEHCCPAIGIMTNSLLQCLTKQFDANKLIKVGKGEYAMPVHETANHPPWIVDYAGKWYRKVHVDLPNWTEVLSVHLSYFRSPEALRELLFHDPFMVKFIAFILMGGAVALLNSIYCVSDNKALEEVEQRQRKSSQMKPTFKAGRPKKILSTNKLQGFGV